MTAIRKVTKNWTQRDGAKIRICDMGNDHLLRTIAMLKRIHQSNLMQAYACESTITAEQAGYAIADAISQMEEVESDHPLFDDLCDERDRRGLKEFP